jgi:DNA-binding GntR family transcriptional regulator
MMIEDPRRYVQMLKFLRTRIEDGTYKPEELLPSIQKLSEETGFSRHTITRAMRILQDEGVVERIPGLGYGATGKTANGRPRQSVVVPITGQARYSDGAAGAPLS